MDDHAFPPPHPPGYVTTRLHNAIVLERRLAGQSATGEILKQDLVHGERTRVVIRPMESNHAPIAETTKRGPVGLGRGERHPRERRRIGEHDEESHQRQRRPMTAMYESSESSVVSRSHPVPRRIPSSSSGETIG